MFWTELLRFAGNVTTLIGLAAIGLIVLAIAIWRLIGKRDGAKTLLIVGSAIIVLVFVVGFFSQHPVYEVRAFVLDPQHLPVNNATVTSSLGGEAKQISGGWQFDIPVDTVPSDHKLTVYAMLNASFLKGQSEVTLGSDFHPNVTIKLTHDETTIRGIITDDAGRALEGVTASIVGFGSEMIRTKADGSFQLAAHAADGQVVRLHAEKPGFLPGGGWYPAGTTPAQIVLRRW